MQWLYASVCAATVLFVWLVVPESQGRTEEQIEGFFLNHVLYLGKARYPDGADVAGETGTTRADAGLGAAATKAEAGEDGVAKLEAKQGEVFVLQCREEPEGAVGDESCVTHL